MTTVIDNVHRAEQMVGKIFTAVCKTKDLTPRRARLLVAVASNPAASQTVLTRSTGIDRSTLATLVRDAEKRGWLKRARKEGDQRSYEVTLTATGKKLLAPAAKALDETATRLLADMPWLAPLAA